MPPSEPVGHKYRSAVQEYYLRKKKKIRQQCVITNRCMQSEQLMSLYKVFWKYINRGNPQMAPFQLILDGGRMGQASVNPRLKDENDQNQTNRK